MVINTALPPARRVITLTDPLRRHRCEVARWALASGRVLNLDALTIVLTARAGQHLRWTTDDVSVFLWSTATLTCAELGIELPASTAETLWSYLLFLSEAGALQGDSLVDLQLELSECAGLNRAGRLRHPASSRRTADVHAFRQRRRA